MKYLEFAPTPLLQPYISHYFVFKANHEDQFMPPFKVSPTGHAYFTFTIGAPWKGFMDNKIVDNIYASLNGQLSQKDVYIQPKGKGTVIGIDFQPMAISKIFGLNMNHFTDKITELPEIMGPGPEILYNKLHQTNDLKEQIHMIENWILNHFSNPKVEFCPNIEETVFLIKNGRGNISLNHISRDLKVSLRTLERKFHQWIGLTPKHFNQIIRVGHIIKEINSKPDLDWDYILENWHFYDRSHFSRVFKQITNRTPGAYLKERISLEKHFIGDGNLVIK